MLLAAGAPAQQRSPEQTPGKWHGIKAEFTNYPRLSREERREILEQFTAVVNVLKDAAPLKPPIGLELTPSIANIDLYRPLRAANEIPAAGALSQKSHRGQSRGQANGRRDLGNCRLVAAASDRPVAADATRRRRDDAADEQPSPGIPTAPPRV